MSYRPCLNYIIGISLFKTLSHQVYKQAYVDKCKIITPDCVHIMGSEPK